MPTEDPLKVSSPPTLSPSIRSSSPNSNVKKCSVKLVDIHSGGGGGPGGAGGAGASSGCAPASTGPPASAMAAASAAAAGQKRDVSKMNNALDDDAALPAAKKAREVKADPPSSLVSGKPCPPPKAASTVAKDSSWLTDKSKETSVSNLESIVPPGGKVTISPARLKEKGGGGVAPPSSAGAAPPASDKPQSLPGAVTITKLSTGTSQQVESKDLKNLLGATDGKISAGSNGIRVPPTPSPNADGGAGAKKSSNSYSVQKQKKLQQQQQLHNNHHLHQPQPQHDPPGGGGGSDISCGKCKQAFSTKEAMRLHTCNSILDSQYLTDSADRHRMMVGGGSHSATSSSAADSKSSSPGSGSSLSRNSSRSNSPLLNSHSAAAATANKPQQPLQDQQSHPSISQLHKSVAAEGKVASGGQSNDAVPCKLIKDERENKLMIEGRPKLSVSKVGGSRGADSGWSKQKKVEGGDSRSATAASSSGAPHPPGGGNGVKRKTNEGSSAAAPPGAPGASGSKDWPKIRIKVGGMSIAAGGGPGGGGESSSSGSGPAAKAVGGGKPAMGHPGVRKAEEEGPFSFTFNGKPTYSPSRVEPSQPNQGKGKSRTDEYCLSPMKEEGAAQIILIQFAESPKDASNKDSPASQSSVADSGVFSIQSNSPSKGDGTTSGTSPDSPNARFPDQQAFGNRDGNGQCKSSHLQLGSSLRITSHNRMHECIHSF